MTAPFDAGLLDAATALAAPVAGDAALLDAMVDVEEAHLAALAAAGAAPRPVTWDRSALDVARIAAEGAAGGNAVIPLVAALRRAAPDGSADAVHLGLTSQDVIDSALMFVAARAIGAAAPAIGRATAGLAALADEERATPALARTLGRPAGPTTAGLRLAVLLDGVVRSWRHLEALELPVQVGGAVGTVAVLADRLGVAGAAAHRADVARRLGLVARPGVWHVERSTVALLGAALAAVVGALGRLGLEVVQGGRPEIGELDLVVPAGAGGSSAMPQKRNPVPAVLLVAAARRAPGLAATLLGAQLALDDRPAGDWHAEWQPLRELLRLVLESAALGAQVVEALGVDAARSRANLDAAGGAVHAERAQQVLAAELGGARAGELVTAALEEDDFVAALRAAAAADLDAAGRDRLAAATTTGGPIGLADVAIDAAIASARGIGAADGRGGAGS